MLNLGIYTWFSGTGACLLVGQLAMWHIGLSGQFAGYPKSFFIGSNCKKFHTYNYRKIHFLGFRTDEPITLGQTSLTINS